LPTKKYVVCDSCVKQLLPKELFIETLEKIKAGLDRRNSFGQAISDVSDSWFVCNVGDEWLKQLIKVLEYSMGDFPSRKYDSIIGWWLFDGGEKKIWWEESGETIEKDLSEPEALYDYLVEKFQNKHKEGI
jgi:hypothetical protein